MPAKTFLQKEPNEAYNNTSINGILGIDLGTTNSVVGVYDRRNKPPVTICQNLQGYLTTPSVVYFHKEDPMIFVG